MTRSERILLSIMVTGSLLCLCFSPSSLRAEDPIELFGQYCLDCHDGETQKGNFDMEALLDKGSFDGTLMFENLITGKMPPAEKKQPTAAERR